MDSSTQPKERSHKWDDKLIELFIQIVRDNKIHIVSQGGDMFSKWKMVTDQFNNHPNHVTIPNINMKSVMVRYARIRDKVRKLIELNREERVFVKMVKEMDEETKQDKQQHPRLYNGRGRRQLLDERRKISRPEGGNWDDRKIELFLEIVRETKAHINLATEYTKRWQSVADRFQAQFGLNNSITAKYCAHRFSVIKCHIRRMHKFNPSYKPNLVRILAEMTEEITEYARLHPTSRNLPHPIVYDVSEDDDYAIPSTSSSETLYTTIHTADNLFVVEELPEDREIFEHSTEPSPSPPETSSIFSSLETITDPDQRLIRKAEIMIERDIIDDDQLFVFTVLFDTPLRQRMMIFSPRVLSIFLKRYKLDDNLLKHNKDIPKTRPSDEDARLYFQKVEDASDMGFLNDRDVFVSTILFDYEPYRQKALRFPPRLFAVWLERAAVLFE